MSIEKGPGNPDNSIGDKIKSEVSHKVRTGPFGNLINRIVVGQKQKEGSQKRDIAKGEENVWLNQQLELAHQRRHNPNHVFTEKDRMVLAKVREIRRAESEVWYLYLPSQLREEILSQVDEQGHLLLGLIFLGEFTINSRQDGDRLRGLMGLIDTLKRQRFNEATTDEAREVINEIELRLTLEVGEPVSIDKI